MIFSQLSDISNAVTVRGTTSRRKLVTKTENHFTPKLKSYLYVHDCGSLMLLAPGLQKRTHMSIFLLTVSTASLRPTGQFTSGLIKNPIFTISY